MPVFITVYVLGLDEGSAQPPGVVFVLLHGEGMAALTWALMAKVIWGVVLWRTPIVLLSQSLLINGVLSKPR